MSGLPSDGASVEMVRLQEACPIVAGAIVSKPVLNAPEGRAVMFAMDAGQEISEHRAPFVATVHVLAGKLRFVIEGKERVLVPGDYLVMPSNAPHGLKALEATHFLLTLFKKA